MTKVQSRVMLVLYNVRIVLSTVRKKKKNHQMWQKYSQIWCCTAQCEDDTIKFEKKNKRITECDKNTVTCNFRGIIAFYPHFKKKKN